MRAQDIPNLISALRILLVVPILWLLLVRHYDMALLLFLIAGFSDALDGFLAKHYGWTSRLGGVLDPLADKMLLTGSYLALGWLGDLPVWLVGLVILRDGVILLGAVAYHLLIEPFEAAPTTISKINTLMQLILVLAVMFNHGVTELPGWGLPVLIALTALTTLVSGGHYVWEWSRRARTRRRERNASH
ncbi:MAG: CDP-alcohol phosphatidyltransferase family protein [Candidatus Competibacteraceae bacterium]|nr:CDP-alcohol phosphatidyltransferase family protein [Candidatus Competibacteraceae bacterium]